MFGYLLFNIYNVYIRDVVEWSRALDVRLSEWCCSVAMVCVQIPSGEEQNLTALKSNSNTVSFNFQTYTYIYILKAIRVRRGRDPMVVVFTTIYAISAYHHLCCEL